MSGRKEVRATAEPCPTPRYRISLRLGNIHSICGIAGQVDGRQHRMQALGLFYEPLGSRQLARRYRSAWRHYRRVAAPAGQRTATDDEADIALADAINHDIITVAGGPAGARSPSALPNPGQFARIRLPGGFCVRPRDGVGPWGYPVPHQYRFNTERQFYAANWRVGALPIIASVEVEDPPCSGTWVSAPAGLHVHFQLIAPDPIPAGSPVAAEPLRAVTVVRAPGAAPFGPERYITNEINRIPAAGVQANNCPNDRGGKRHGGAAGGDYFDTVNRQGFNDMGARLPVAGASRHNLAVQAQTNAVGEAGVIFRPSRQGGDRFKIRAFLDPVGSTASDGTGASAVKAETGTMVIWKTIRISRYIRFNYPAGIPAANQTTIGGALDEINFQAEHVNDFSRCYGELIIEPTASRENHRVGDAAWQAAIRWARGNARPRGTAVNYDMNTLFPDALPAAPTGGLIRMLTPAAYNGARPAGTAAAVAADWGRLLTAMLEMFMHYYTNNANSGVCVIQAPAGDSITVAQRVAGIVGFISTSGQATNRRGCFLFWARNSYNNVARANPIEGTRLRYDIQRNTLHEIGHCLFLPHHWTGRDPATGAATALAAVPNEHDYQDYCIMGYNRCHGDFCGRCNLKLRGWDTSGIPLNRP